MTWKWDILEVASMVVSWCIVAFFLPSSKACSILVIALTHVDLQYCR